MRRYKMKRQHRGYIKSVLCLSLCSCIMHVVMQITDSWVVANTSPLGNNSSVAYINYGLYRGSVHTIGEEVTLTITCLLDLNVCAWTCQTMESQRREELAVLYYSGRVLNPCISNYSKIQSVQCEEPLIQTRQAFIDGTVWTTTVVATTTSGFISWTALLITVYNVNHVPPSSWVSIRGLCYYFGFSGILTLLALALWGCEFSFKLTKNIAIVDTIAGIQNSNGNAHLGFSYWILLVVTGLQTCCIFLLQYRETLFDKRPTYVCPLKVNFPYNKDIALHLYIL